MRLETTAGALRSALDVLGRVVPKASAAPLMQSVQFDGATARATDLNNYVEVDLAVTRAEGKASILHRPLAALMRHIDRDEAITLEAGAQGATLRFSGGRYDLPTVEGDDLRMSGAFFKPMALDGATFKKGMRFCLPFVCDEETRYYLNGICLADGNMVSTNGHRMAVYPVAELAGETRAPIISRTSLALLSKLPEPSRVFIGRDEQPVMRFDMPGVRITSKLIDGTYPDWRRVVPEISADCHCLTLDRRALLKVVRRVSVALNATGGLRGVALAYNQQSIALGGASDHGLKAREYLSDVAISGVAADAHIEFNSTYLASVLEAFPAEERVSMFVRDAGSVSLFRCSQDGPFTLLMPQRAGSRGLDLANEALQEWSRPASATEKQVA
ncbi:DNA polymerase III subunit beta [Nitratireductor aquimarinus]|uniref:DNA polymerase III subunit beta n=1 Tax=Nitratireductor aquimarinus TaxID=889300 RepID=UPI0029361F8F|nr:DNA polymerase III subunit beta [Nitratireductor aquimarinus]MDV2967823.1 DNA polymerase III subunit beta [Nitratireductor aquimarinus]